MSLSPLGLTTARYEADISEYSGGRFIVTDRRMNLVVIHADPERQFCHELTQRGVPDGPIQFYRADLGGMASISFKSVYRAAKHHTSLGEEFPNLKKRDTGTAASVLRGVSEAPVSASTPRKSARLGEFAT